MMEIFFGFPPGERWQSVAPAWAVVAIYPVGAMTADGNGAHPNQPHDVKFIPPPVGAALTSWPANRYSPPKLLWSIPSVHSRDVFPDPLSPRMTLNDPARIDRS
jgi:hypothetical protein